MVKLVRLFFVVLNKTLFVRRNFHYFHAIYSAAELFAKPRSDFSCTMINSCFSAEPESIFANFPFEYVVVVGKIIGITHASSNSSISGNYKIAIAKDVWMR